MADGIGNSREDTLRKTYEVVVDGVILGRPTWLSRHVDDWSRHTFPPATAKVVAAAVVTLPLVALFFLTPPVLAVLLICIAPYLGRIVNARERALRVVDEADSLNHNAFINSMGFVNIVFGIRGIVNGIFGKGPLTIDGIFGTTRITVPFATFATLIGCFAFCYSHFLQDIVEAARSHMIGYSEMSTPPTRDR